MGFIDDLFAFIIKMPTLYRLGTLRDDLIFFIYLYQKWIYPTDMKRTNEFGLTGDQAEGRVDQPDGPESDEIRVENDEQPIEPAISIFDLIENEKSKGDTAWKNALKSQPLLPVADLDSKMEHLNSRFEVLFKSLAELRSEGNFEELYL